MSYMWMEDPDEAFIRGNWEKAGGNLQSLLFATEALYHLHNFEPIADFKYRDGDASTAGCIIRDYGCAHGDGTAALAAAFPASTVHGYDRSPAAVAIAQRRWPTLRFFVGDILEPKSADIIFTSHTLEHLKYPADALQGLRRACRLLIVVVPPITADNDGGHKDAVPFEEWISEVPATPIFQASYHTCRFNVEKRNLLPEGNHLLVYKGLL